MCRTLLLEQGLVPARYYRGPFGAPGGAFRSPRRGAAAGPPVSLPWWTSKRFAVAPGRIGYGADLTAGRGTGDATIGIVTNLNSSGAGSLPYVLANTPRPAIIVFNVGGVCDMGGTDIVESTNGAVSIYGQTAPDPGFWIINGGFYATAPTAAGMYVAHLGVFRGDEGGSYGSGYDTADAGRAGIHTYFDHCAFLWGVDGGLDFIGTSGTGASTAYQCFVAECLRHSKHSEGSHSRNTTQQNNFGKVAYIRGLSAGAHVRNPYVSHNTNAQILNCVIPYSKHAYAPVNPKGDGKFVVVNIASPSERHVDIRGCVVHDAHTLARIDVQSGSHANSRYYSDDFLGTPTGYAGGSCGTPTQTWVSTADCSVIADVPTAPAFPDTATIWAAADTEARVYATCGPRVLRWDEAGAAGDILQRIISQSQAGTGIQVDGVEAQDAAWEAAYPSIPTKADVAAEWAALKAMAPTSHDLEADPLYPASPAAIQASGYTAIEEYIHTYWTPTVETVTWAEDA